MKAYKPKKHYRWHPGFVAWALHRFTGLALAGYLILHLYVLHNLAKGPDAFNSIMAAMSSTFTRLLEIGLLAVVVYHTVNGLRIVLMDYGPMAEKESYKKYLTITLAVIGGIVAVGGIVMLVHIFTH